MRPVVRLGAVNYLNVRPLVDGLDRHQGFSLRFDVPSLCAALLDEGTIDLGMVPSITYLNRPGDCIVPGVCIGSEGAVASVALFTRRPMSDVRTIALDTSSRTSAALVRILCRRVFHITPTFLPHAPDLDSMLAVADAALLIGDPALFLDHRAYGTEKVDLGEEWTRMTGLPFVWAFWAGRSGAVDVEAVSVLQDAARRGTARVDQIAADYCQGHPERVALAQAYLRRHLAFDLSSRAVAGLTTYYQEAVDAGVVPAPGSLRFFEGPAGTI